MSDPAPLPTVIPCWAVVNVLGHTTYYGFVDLVDVAGAAMLRVTEPAVAATPITYVGEGDDRRVEEPGKRALPESVVVVPRQSLHSIVIDTEAAVRESRRAARPSDWGDDDHPF